MTHKTSTTEIFGQFIIFLIGAFIFAVVIGFGLSIFSPYRDLCPATVEINDVYFLDSNGDKVEFLAVCND